MNNGFFHISFLWVFLNQLKNTWTLELNEEQMDSSTTTPTPTTPTPNPPETTSNPLSRPPYQPPQPRNPQNPNFQRTILTHVFRSRTHSTYFSLQIFNFNSFGVLKLGIPSHQIKNQGWVQRFTPKLWTFCFLCVKNHIHHSSWVQKFMPPSSLRAQPHIEPPPAILCSKKGMGLLHLLHINRNLTFSGSPISGMFQQWCDDEGGPISWLVRWSSDSAATREDMFLLMPPGAAVRGGGRQSSEERRCWEEDLGWWGGGVVMKEIDLLVWW